MHEEPEIKIKDNGCGIADEDLPHIFERFYRGIGDRNQSGSGLGLAIAKEIMNHLGDDISVTSKQGIGTTFTLTLQGR